MVVVLLVLVVLPQIASAQIYRWTDERGQVSYSQGLESVPERYRSGARLVGSPEPPVATSRPQSSAASPGLSRIPFTPGRPIMVKARINDSGVADLMLDTGAQVTIINPRVLAALGVGMRDAQRSTLRGVTGSAEAFAVSLDSLEVAGARVAPLTIVSHDVGFDGDGLLGRDFLDRFTVNIDNRAGIVTLTPR
jgi:predicted aspartyl protease